MEHEDQHREAIIPTVRVKDEVTARIFDDKVRDMGTVKVEGGKIVITLESLPSMDEVNQMNFTLDAIRLSLEACWTRKPEAFNPY